MKSNHIVIVLNNIISIVQIVFGGINVFFWGVGGISAFTNENIEFDISSLMMALCLAIIGGIILYCGIKRVRMGKKLKNYENAIGVESGILISDLSNRVHESETQIESDFQWLIKKNFLTDAYISNKDRSIVFKEAYAIEQEAKRKEEEAKRNIQYISVVCECCNGTTKIVKGKEGVCSYCGAPIK